MKPLYLDGLTFNPAMIESVRKYLIYVRDHALKVTDFDSAIQLSWAIALLAHLAANTEQPE